VALDLTVAPVSTSAAFRTNTALTLGSAPAEGSLIIVTIGHENKAGITPTVPTGFTALTGSPISHSVADFKCSVAYKVAGASEGATHTWTHGNAFTQGAIYNITGNDTTSPIDGTPTSGQATNGTSFAFSSVTTTADNSALVAIGFSTVESTSNTASWSAPLTERVDSTLIDIASGVQASAGASGAKSATTIIGNLVWFMFAVKEDAGGPPQLLQPDSTESAGTWTTDSGGTTNLHLSVDEATPGSDTDYIQSVLAPSAAAVELGLPTPSTPDAGSRKLRYRRQQSPSSTRAVNLTASIYRGATLVEAFTDTAIPNAWAQKEHTLTSDPAGWDDLRVRFAATQDGPPAPTFVAAGTAAYTATNGATIAPALPSGWAADDIHILLIARSDNTAATSITGWTKITPSGAAENNTAAQRVELWWRRAVAGDSAPTITFGSGTVVRGGRIYGIRGCPTASDPFDATIRENTAAPANANVVSSGVTTTVANTLALFLYAYEDDPTTASQPTNWAAITPSTSSAGNDMSLGHSTRTFASAGATGSVTTGLSGGTFTNSPNASFVLAFKPHPGTDARAQISWVEFQVPAGGGDATATLTVASATTAAVAPTATGGSAATLTVATSAGAAPAITAVGVNLAALTTATSSGAALAPTATGGAAATLTVASSAAAAPTPSATAGSVATLTTGTSAGAANAVTTAIGADATLTVASAAAAAAAITATAGSVATLTTGTSAAAAPAITAGVGSSSTLPVATSAGAASAPTVTGGAAATLAVASSAGAGVAITAEGGAAPVTANLPVATATGASSAISATAGAVAALAAAASSGAAPAISAREADEGRPVFMLEKVAGGSYLNSRDVLEGAFDSRAATETLGFSLFGSDAATVAAFQPVTDTLDFTVSETAAVAASVAVTDDLSFSFSETVDISVPVAASDTLTFTLTEDVTLAVSLDVTDTLAFTVEEVVEVGITADFEFTDDLSFTFDESIRIDHVGPRLTFEGEVDSGVITFSPWARPLVVFGPTRAAPAVDLDPWAQPLVAFGPAVAQPVLELEAA
jgi:hypothetical protein